MGLPPVNDEDQFERACLDFPSPTDRATFLLGKADPTRAFAIIGTKVKSTSADDG